MLISPRNTLTSCGSSSRLVLRSHRPTRVTRTSSVSLYGASGSFRGVPSPRTRRIASRWTFSSALWRSVRNLKQLNRLLVSPDPTLAKDRGSGTVEVDRYPHHHEHGGQHHDRENADRDVERPLAEFPRDRLPSSGFMRRQFGDLPPACSAAETSVDPYRSTVFVREP